MLISFTGRKNDDPSHPDFVPTQFSFVQSPIKAKVKRDLTKYHRSQEIKAKRLKFSVSSKSGATDGTDVISSDDDHSETTCLLELQQRDESCEVGVVRESQDTCADVTKHLLSSATDGTGIGCTISDHNDASTICSLELQQRDESCEVGVVSESQSTSADVTQHLLSNTDEVDTESQSSHVNIDSDHTDVFIADAPVNDTIPVALSQREYKQMIRICK